MINLIRILKIFIMKKKKKLKVKSSADYIEKDYFLIVIYKIKN